MRIVFTAKGTEWDSDMDPRFGRTQYLLIYDDKTDDLVSFDNREIDKEAHGAGTKTSQRLFDLNPDVLITGNGPGGNAQSILERTKVEIYTGAGEMTVREAYEAFKNSKLPKY